MSLLQHTMTLQRQQAPPAYNEPTLPYKTVMTFTEFMAYWRSVSEHPPNQGFEVQFRVFCEKLNERLDDMATSPYKEKRRRFEQEKDKYVNEHNPLGEWMKRVWEFIFGNAALGAEGRPNFLTRRGA